MDDAAIDQEIITFRQSLFAYWRRIDQGDRAVGEDMRRELDALICLRDEADERKHAKIDRLVGQYEALLLKLAH